MGLHSPQKSIKFVKFHYFSIKKLKSLRSRLSILKAIFGQKPDFVNTSTLGLPWEYCASTLGVLPPVLWEYCLSTLGVLHQYLGTTLGVLCQYSGSTAPVLWEYCTSTLGLPWEYCASTLLGHHTHQQFQQAPCVDNHTAGHTYTEQVCSAKYCRTAFLKIWIFKNLILSIF